MKKTIYFAARRPKNIKGQSSLSNAVRFSIPRQKFVGGEVYCLYYCSLIVISKFVFLIR